MGVFGGGANGWEADFADYARGRYEALRATAYLLCADWHRAEDLCQIALIRLYQSWRRIDHSSSVDGYARQVLVRTFLNERRRWRREVTCSSPPDRAEAVPEPVAERLELIGALQALPDRQRAAVVLRYWEGFSVAEAAMLLDVPEGTVKTWCSRGLASLRDLLVVPAHDDE